MQYPPRLIPAAPPLLAVVGQVDEHPHLVRAAYGAAAGAQRAAQLEVVLEARRLLRLVRAGELPFAALSRTLAAFDDLCAACDAFVGFSHVGAVELNNGVLGGAPRGASTRD